MAKKEDISIKPLSDRVLVEPIGGDGEKTASGIIIPETIEGDKPFQGKVLAVGPGKFGDDNEIIPMTVKVGDKVIFSKYSPNEVKMDDKEYYIISESDILAVID